ncbi:MAG: alpha/beta hydrolase, partial [Cyanobacteria bacterium J06638_22]
MKQWKLGLAVVLGISGLFSGRAIAAEEILLRYGIFERAVAVSDLSQLAETGEATDQLESYFDTAEVSA